MARRNRTARDGTSRSHTDRKTCRLGWPREVGVQDSSPQSRIFTTSSPGRFSLALEVGRPREMRPGDEVGIFTSVTVGSKPCSYWFTSRRA